MQRVTVKRDAIAQARVETLPPPPLNAGEIRLCVESFALTANNITYAAMGSAMKYWDFFPVEAGEGVVPVWGFASVTESAVAAIAVGERVYGYLPMASELVVTPGAVRGGSFSDAAPHRAALAAVYNQYQRVRSQPGADEDLRALFEPLFLTSWLIERMFARDGWHAATQIVMTSASSKTALALAHLVRGQAPQIRRIGLTAAGNVDFVRATGLYDDVLGYDAIERVPGGASVAVDFAGNGAILARVHTALRDDLRYSCLVGLTHWQDRAGGAAMTGPRLILFFAPDHAAATLGELGAAGFASAKDAAWAAFIADARALMPVTAVTGLDAAAAAYRALVAGSAPGGAALVVRV
jgi:hypothetical protein